MLTAIREFRAAHKLSRNELGKRIGVDAMTIQRWERGENVPHKRFWQKIKDETGVSLDLQITREAE